MWIRVDRRTVGQAARRWLQALILQGDVPLLRKVNGNATPQAVIAFCPMIFPAKIPSMRGYSPITNIPITAGMDS